MQRLARLIASLIHRQHSKPVHAQITYSKFRLYADGLYQANQTNPFRRANR